MTSYQLPRLRHTNSNWSACKIQTHDKYRRSRYSPHTLILMHSMRTFDTLITHFMILTRLYFHGNIARDEGYSIGCYLQYNNTAIIHIVKRCTCIRLTYSEWLKAGIGHEMTLCDTFPSGCVTACVTVKQSLPQTYSKNISHKKSF